MRSIKPGGSAFLPTGADPLLGVEPPDILSVAHGYLPGRGLLCPCAVLGVSGGSEAPSQGRTGENFAAGVPYFVVGLKGR